MMFVKGKDEALLKSITGIMNKTAQQTEEQRKKAAQYLEKTTYAGMRLSEAMDWEPEEPAKEPTEAQKKESDRIKATTGKRNKEALEKISAAFAKKKVDETVELTQEEIARLEEIAQGTTPKTAREKDLAAKAEPKDKITHKDVMVARGVAKEEVELGEGIKSMVHKFLAKRASKKADDAYDMGDEKEFQKQVDKSEYHRVKAGGKPTRINKNPDAKFLTTREEIELDESVKIIDRDSDLDQEHFKLSVNGKPVHFVHHNYEGGHATDSKQDIHYQVKNQLKHLSDADKKKVTDTVHASYRMKEEVELEEAVGDNHLHVQQVKHEGQTKYKVHAVGKNFADGIKVGEHLSDTELDDFSEMGGKIKHVKPAAAKPMKEARTLAAILDEARGRPSKKASEDEDEDDEGPDTGPEADQNIMVHLRKSTDTEGNHDVKFSDGSSHKVPAHVAHKVLGAMEKLKPADRAKIQSHIQQSHANLMAVHKMVS